MPTDSHAAPIEVDWNAPVAVIRLSRPESHNAYNLAMRDALAETLQLLVVADDYRVVVLEGAGRSFCAGADLREFGAVDNLAGAREVRLLRDVFLMIRNLPQVTIASMHGHVIGSGLELALECDLRYATNSASFRMPETRLGFIPAAGGTQTLPRATSSGLALDVVLSGRALQAREAWRVGLVSRLYSDEERHDATLAVAWQIADSTSALAIKSLIRQAGAIPSRRGLSLCQEGGKLTQSV